MVASSTFYKVLNLHNNNSATEHYIDFLGLLCTYFLAAFYKTLVFPLHGLVKFVQHTMCFSVLSKSACDGPTSKICIAYVPHHTCAYNTHPDQILYQDLMWVTGHKVKVYRMNGKLETKVALVIK